MEHHRSSGGDTETPKRVLIVEDSDTDYLLVARYLQKTFSDIACTRAENRAQLLAALMQPFDLIVTDYHLPDIEGSELLATIATAQIDVPCIVLSGSMAELSSIARPQNVAATLEKGDLLHLPDLLHGIFDN